MAMKRLLAVAAALFAICVSASAQDWAKATLEKSPRHQEWVTIKHDHRVVHAFIVYPEVKTKAPAVLVIHEIFGLTDWVRSVAAGLAA
jgi:carboxymethylenebutenolidase